MVIKMPENQTTVSKLTPVIHSPGFVASSIGILIVGTVACILPGPISPAGCVVFTAAALVAGTLLEFRRPEAWAFAPVYVAGLIILSGCALTGALA